MKNLDEICAELSEGTENEKNKAFLHRQHTEIKNVAQKDVTAEIEKQRHELMEWMSIWKFSKK